MSYVSTVRNRGLDPDDFTVESWEQAPNTPSLTFPESQSFTFMNLVAYFANPSASATFWGSNHAYFRQTDPAIFDWKAYLSWDANVQAWVTQNFGNQQQYGAESHWLNYGVGEGRRGAWTFAANFYLQHYSDLAGAYGITNYAGGIDHYFVYGRNEGRIGRLVRLDGGLQHSIVQRTQPSSTTVAVAGQGINGQLGYGGTGNSSTPIVVNLGSQVTDVGAGDYNSLVMNIDGRVNAWGNNQYGLVGGGTAGGQYNSPVLVQTFKNGTVQTGDGRHTVSSNYGECAAVDASGQLWMWGLNSSGQLGDGTTTAHYSPQLVLSSPGIALTGIVSVAAGASHTAALRNDGTVWNWGTGQNGALGSGSTAGSLYPVQVMTGAGQPLTNVAQIATGGSRFTLAVKSDGSLWGWGANGAGQLGVNDQTDRLYATQITGVGVVDQIAAGAYHSVCHSATYGHVYGWGYNGYGQLGNPAAAVNQKSPIQMREDNGMTSIGDVAAGGYFTLLLRSTDQKVFVVGDNQSGQLGVGDTTARAIPVLSQLGL